MPVLIENDRKPRDLAAVEYFVDGVRQAYVWDRNAWVRIDDVEAADEAPLSGRGRNGLAACVAKHYVDEFGGAITAGIALQARNFQMALSLKYGAERETVTDSWF